METNQFVRKQAVHKKGIPKNYEAKDKVDIVEKVTRIEKKKSSKDVTFIIKTLRSHFVFYALSDSDLESIVNELFYCEAHADTFLFKQGDDATCFFILDKGSCQVIINEQVRRKINPGDSFGELALLYSAPRSASIKTLEECSFWAIDRVSFRKAVEELTNNQYDSNRQFIEDIKFFQSLTNDQKDGIAGVLTTQKFTKDQNIVSEGDPGSSYYIIKEGTVSVQKGTKEVRKLYRGESFGEQALYYNTARTMTCKSIDDNAICLALGRDMMVKILGDGIQVIILRNTQRWAIQKSQLFSKLTKIQIEKLLDAIKIFNHKTGDVLIKKGTVCQKLLIVMEGAIRKESDHKNSIGKGGIFGDEYFMDENKKKIMEDNIIVEKDASIGEVDRKWFEENIGASLDQILKRNEASHEKKTFLVNDRKTQSEAWKLTDLLCLKKLGHGQFGAVYLVKHKDQSEMFALKCVSKQQIIEQNLEKYLKQERMVCDMANFPFIMQFLRSYKDDYQIYFLLEYIKGMELFDVIRDIGLLKTYDCQYYIGSMILAIEYLHSFNIIYRDIKPENIMIDHTGVLKMIDMGTAKILKGRTGAGSRTFTIIGTPHYMAPEIIGGKGYNIMVDLWSIGVCFYEFMCGMVPFGEECDDPYEIYEEVIKKSLKFPNYVEDKKAKKLMEQLLHKVPEIRMGTSYAALKANPFFGTLDWDKLIDKQLKPPYVPPKEKIISDKEIEKMALQKKAVIDEILSEQKNLKPASKMKIKDPSWDKEF